MNKQEFLEETYNSALNDELEKIAVSIDSIENRIGGYLTDEQEEVARDLIKKEKAKSFIMRHPWLTGLPTLGILPMAAHSIAQERIAKKMILSDPVIAALNKAKQQRIHEINVAEASASNISNVTNVEQNRYDD